MAEFDREMQPHTDANDGLARKWWVDTGRADRPPSPQPLRDRSTLAGMRFYKVAEGFEQEAARERLTDNNLKVLLAAAPEPGRWKVVVFVPQRRAPQREIMKVTSTVVLPDYARGVIADCGRVLRLLVTGTPIGERILEMVLTEPPSFDAWIGDEWVEELVFPGPKKALREFRGLIRKYLAPEAIALWKGITPAV